MEARSRTPGVTARSGGTGRAALAGGGTWCRTAIRARRGGAAGVVAETCPASWGVDDHGSLGVLRLALLPFAT